jgi:putative CocE/NonD family hydrolase
MRIRRIATLALVSLLMFMLAPLANAGAATDAQSGQPTSIGTFEVNRVDENWTMQDGVRLPVSVFFPLTSDNDARFPLIVFVHPLGMEMGFYESTAMEYAGKGYVTLIYSVRGAFAAEGRFNIIDPATELPDLSHIITLASEDARFPIIQDEKGPVVGVTGYSMGGVHSFLIAPRKDPRPGDPGDQRVRTTVPIHGGADLLYSILPNNAPNIMVGGVILGASYLQNLFSFSLKAVKLILREDLQGWDKLTGLLQYLASFVQQPINWVDPNIAWAVGVFMQRDESQYDAAKAYIEQRSVRYWCDEEYDGVVEHPITVPMLIITGWNDDAFFPNQGLRILSTCMDTPGRMIITNHGHLAGFGDNFYLDVPGNPEYEWVDSQVTDWFDHYLKGIDNGADEQPRVTYYRDRDPEHFGQASDYPLPGTSDTPYYLGAGSLSTSKQIGDTSQSDFLLNIGATGSLSLLYYQDVPQLLGGDTIQIPKKLDFFEIPFTEREYLSDPLGQDTTIMGAPELEVYYQSSQSHTQLNPSLYEVMPDGTETLVSRGAYEGYNPQIWSMNSTAANPIEMQACYHRFLAGSRIKLEIATADLIDIWPVPYLSFILLHHHRDMASRLVLPVVPDSY